MSGHVTKGEDAAALVIGAGGQGEVVLRSLRSASIEVEAVVDDNEARWGEELFGVPIRGPIASIAGSRRPAVIAIGDNAMRRKLAETLDLRWLTVVHPAAWVDETATLEPGAVVAAGAVLQPLVRVGAHAIVNSGAVVDHGCVLGAYCHVGPGCALSGQAEVGDGALLGVGATVLPGVRIGRFAVLGAGGVATRPIPDGATAVGVPARVVQPRGAEPPG